MGKSPAAALRAGRGGLGGGRLAPAWGAEVVSSNIVGYHKISLSPGYNMIGTSFQTVGGDKEISVQDIKGSGLTGVDWTWETEAGDTLLIWDAANKAYLTTLYYTGDTATEEMTEEGAVPGTWFDLGDSYATSDYVFKNGDAFWVLSSGANATVTIAGEVPTETDSISIVPGYNMIGNPYPKAVAVNDLFTITGLTGVDWTWETEAGDTLTIWDPVNKIYSTTLYWTGDTATPEMTEEGAEPATWFDLGDTYSTATTVIPVSGAFWIKSSGSGTLTFK